MALLAKRHRSCDAGTHAGTSHFNGHKLMYEMSAFHPIVVVQKVVKVA